MSRKPLWLDCDPGHDDALAILLACNSPAVELLGVSTVACNQTIEKTTQNALAVLHAAGHDSIPVYQGQAKPLMRTLPTCAEIHGETGLDSHQGGRLFPDSPVLARSEKAVIAMAEAINKQHAQSAGSGASQPVELVCTGALTNAALVFTLFPETVARTRVTIMGGALGVGNTGPVQEFNIQTDPEAAKIVFECGVPVTMVPIEVTHTFLATHDVVGSIRELATPFSARIVDLLAFFASTYREVFKFEHPPVHDPVAVAYVIDPGLFEVELMRVDVEVVSSLSAGQTVCDVWNQSKLPKNVLVAMKVDVARCWQLILDAIKRSNLLSPLNAANV